MGMFAQIKQRKGKASRRSGYLAAQRRFTFRPKIEGLENRIVPATHTWKGLGATANWSDAGNWDTTPMGDSTAALVFPAITGNPNFTNTNNLPVLTVQSISFTGGGYTISEAAGDGITLTPTTGGISSTTGTNTFNVDITLGAAATFTDSTSTTLNLGGVINSGGFLLTATNVGALNLTNTLGGSGGLTKSGSGTLTLSGGTFTGPVTTSAGTTNLSYLIDTTTSGQNFTTSGGTLNIGVNTAGLTATIGVTSTVKATGGTINILGRGATGTGTGTTINGALVVTTGGRINVGANNNTDNVVVLNPATATMSADGTNSIIAIRPRGGTQTISGFPTSAISLSNGGVLANASTGNDLILGQDITHTTGTWVLASLGTGRTFTVNTTATAVVDTSRLTLRADAGTLRYDVNTITISTVVANGNVNITLNGGTVDINNSAVGRTFNFQPGFVVMGSGGLGTSAANQTQVIPAAGVTYYATDGTTASVALTIGGSFDETAGTKPLFRIGDNDTLRLNSGSSTTPYTVGAGDIMADAQTGADAAAFGSAGGSVIANTAAFNTSVSGPNKYQIDSSGGTLTTDLTGTGTVLTKGIVASATVSAGGSGYTAAPTVAITGGGGSGATATAGLAVLSVAVTNGGSGYTSAPTVTFAAPPSGGTRATGTAVLDGSGTHVASITITNAGAGYTSVPAITFSGGGGSGAAATATMRVGSVTITAGGSGYTSVPTITISSGGGTGATAYANMLVAITMSGGTLITGPTFTVAGGESVGITGAATMFAVNGSTITSLTLNGQLIVTGSGTVGGSIQSASTGMVIINGNTTLSLSASGNLGSVTLLSPGGSSGQNAELNANGSGITVEIPTTVTLVAPIVAGVNREFGAQAGTLQIDVSDPATIQITGTNTLNLNRGAGVVAVGLLNLNAGRFVAFNSGGPTTTTVATGATLSGKGAYGNSNNMDVFINNGTVTATGTLQIDAATINGTGSWSYASGITLTLNGSVTDNPGPTPLSLVAGGAGTLVLAKASTYTGGSTVLAGILRAGATGALGTGAVVVGDTSGTANATLQISASGASLANAITVQAGSSGTATISGTNTTGTATYSGGITLLKSVILDAASGGTVSFTGVIDDGAGSFSLTKGTSAGTVVLTKANTYDGGTTILAGTLRVSLTGALGTGAVVVGDTSGTAAATLQINVANVTVANPITIQAGSTGAATLTASYTSGTSTFSGGITLLKNVTLDSTGNAAILDFSNVIDDGTGSFAVTKGTGSGIVALDAVNTYDGGTTVLAGTLRAGNNSALGTGAVVVGNTTGTAAATLQISAAGVTVANPITVQAGSTGTATLGSNVAGTTTFSGGITLLKGATLDASSATGTVTFAGVIDDGASSFPLTKGTGTGTVILNGANTYDGGTTILAGILQAGSNSALGTGAVVVGDTTGTANAALQIAAAGVTVANPITVQAGSTGTATLGSSVTGITTFSGTISLLKDTTIDTATGAVVISGVVSSTGAFGLIKTGTGTLTLSATDTYTGATTINAGTVLVTGALAAASAVTVNTGGTLGGTGSVGAVTASGGTVSPGSSIAVLTAASADFSGGGTLNVQVAGTTTAGTDYDQLNLGTGSLTLGGTSTLVLDLAGLSASGTVNGIVLYGSVTGTFTTVTLINNPNAFTATVNYTASAINVTFMGAIVSTMTTVSSSANPSVFGQAVTFTATVMPTGSGTPTGTVTFTVDGVAQTPVALNGSAQATIMVSSFSVSSHTISATYNGDSNFGSSTSAPFSQTVNKADTTAMVSASVNPSVFGQAVTFTATVTATAPGMGTPSGMVTFSIDGMAQSPVTLNGSGQATFVISSLSVTGHMITAAYSGDGNFNTSTSTTFTQTVNKADTGTAVSSSANPSVFGQSVTFTATVTAVAPGAGTPAGTVTFTIDGMPQPPVALNGSGQASFMPTSLGVTSHTVSVAYNGNSSFNTSTSTPLTQTVNKADTTTGLTASVNPSVFGQSVTFMAQVSAAGPGAGIPTGSVTFTIDTMAQPPVNLDASGRASVSSSTLGVGSHTVSVAYGGDASFSGSASSPLTQTVNKANTTTGLTASVNPSVFGQSVTFTAQVSAAGPGAGIPTGSVTFTIDTMAQPPVNLDASGRASVSSSTLGVGSHTVSVAYGGDASFSGSASSNLSQTVNQANTTTTVSSSVNPSTVGQSVTFTAQVSAVAPGMGTPSGMVIFTIDTMAQPPVNLDASGRASVSTSTLGVGSHTISVAYGGDASFNASTSNTLTQTVNPSGTISTTTAVVSAVNPSAFGQSVTFTATVTPNGSGTPTGSITFTIDGTAQAPVALNGSAQASINVASLGVGSHTVSAAYGGDGTFTGSTSPAISQTVNKADTTTALTSSANPSVFGQSVTFTAQVSAVAPGAGTPSGTVTFTVDGTARSPINLNGSGQATLALSNLGVGSHTIRVAYNGSGSFNTSTSSTLTQTVNKANTTTTVSSSANPAVFGQSITFTAQVSAVAPGAGTPGGTVTFTVDGTARSPINLNGSGRATLTISNLGVGSHTVRVAYNGSGSFNTSTSSTLTQTVNKANTTTTVSSSANPSVFGQSVTFTVQVRAVAPGAGTPTGTVTFTVDGTARSPINLNGSGRATLTISNLGVGSHTVRVAYNGSGSFNTSTSSTLTQTVNKANTQTQISSSPNPSVLGQTVTFTATVRAVAPGSGTPTGTVTFTIDGVAQTPVTLGSGQATFSTSTLGAGSHQIAAAYSGSSSFNVSTSATLTQVVNSATASRLVLSGLPETVTADALYGINFTALDANGNVATGYTGTVHVTSTDPLASIDPQDYTFTADNQGMGVFYVILRTSGRQSVTVTDVMNPSLNATVTTTVVQPVLFGRATNYAAGPNPAAVATGDLNGDGIPDLVVADRSTNRVSVLLGNGDGSFQPPVAYFVGNNPTSVALADVNFDGGLDIIATNFTTNTVSVLLGYGDGTFTPAQSFATGAGPIEVAVADFNLDGIPDLVTANYYDNTISVLLGNGDGTFQPPLNYFAGFGPSSVTVADYNLDGAPDVAVADFNSNQVSVLLDYGDATFTPAMSFDVGAGPIEVATGDVNFDGAPDLVVANQNGNTVSVLLDYGDGTFTPAANYFAGSIPAWVGIGDFDGDGAPDIVVTNYGSNRVSVLLGNYDGTFRAPLSYAVGANPLGAAIGDFNLDGQLDLVAANVGGSTVSVLLHPPAGEGDGPGVDTGAGNGAGLALSQPDSQGLAATLLAIVAQVGPANPAPVVFPTQNGPSDQSAPNPTATQPGGAAAVGSAGSAAADNTGQSSITAPPVSLDALFTVAPDVRLLDEMFTHLIGG